jgi:hypothetical protein
MYLRLMKLHPNKSLLAMAACIAFSVILTGTLTAGYLDHSHTEEKVHLIGPTAKTDPDCPICQKIERAEIFLNALKLASIILFFISCFVFIAQTQNAHKAYVAYLLSPVALKVRFNT